MEILMFCDQFHKKIKKIVADAAKNDNCKYIEKTKITEEMKNKVLVAIDPNHGNLISCMAENNHEIRIVEDCNGKTIESKHEKYLKFRYTRRQRNVETRNDKYKKLRENKKKKPQTNGKTMEEIESTLSKHNSKTCNATKFKAYLKEKNSINRMLYEYYEEDIYRKLKLNIYINTQKK